LDSTNFSWTFGAIKIKELQIYKLILFYAVKTFGASFPDSCQFVTVNRHLHTFPSFNNPQCTWLGTVDTKDGILTVVFSRAGLAIRESLVILRDHIS